MKFRIQRYDPDKDARPYLQDYDIEMGPSDRMLLDALIRIKTFDDTLALRRSCRFLGIREPEQQTPAQIP